MLYKSFLPGPYLSEFIRNYTIIHFQFGVNEPAPSKQRSAKPEQKIVFYLKGVPVFYNPSTGCTKTPPPVAIFSHQSDQRTIKLSSEFFAFIIFLQPGVLHRLTRLPMMELPDEFCDAELFFGTEVREVSEQLATANTHSAMISRVENFLIDRCRQMPVKSSIDTIALNLLADPTSFSLDAVARQACLSSRQFYRKFTERVGISPKLFSRLSRFNHAYRYKIQHPNVSWSAIAQEFYYTDYHHLEKEFKEFTLLTPQEWTKAHLAAPERILKLR
ncbi:MAG: helix-turn-helix domain-containing protein [Bacteroidota bacterium]